ncbi:MAG: hypothetical protein K2Z81_11855, partial [Cyanobacteria bacterium]|nr:hypothetical protein [Cyanobacteriota bacterium]
RTAENHQTSVQRCHDVTQGFTNSDWEAVRLLKSMSLATRAGLPQLELRNDGTPVQEQNGDVTYQSGDVGIQIGTDSINAHAGRLGIRRDQASGNLEFTDRRNGQLVLEIINGERVWRTPDGQLLKHVGNQIVVLNPDGSTRGTIDNNQIRERFSNGTVIVDATAESLEEALRRARENGLQIQPGEQVVVRFGRNLAILDPMLNQFIVFNHTEGGVEVHFKLDDDRTLCRGADGKVRILNRNGTITELSDEQKQELLTTLGAFGQQIQRLIGQVQNGSLQLDNHSITLDQQLVTVTCTQIGRGSLAQLISGVHGFTYRTGPHSSDESSPTCPTSTTVDLVNRNVTRIIGTSSTQIDLTTPNLDVTTDNFTIRDNAVEFIESGVRVDRENNVSLPDGSELRNNGDVKFADGSYYSRETHSLSGGDSVRTSNDSAGTGKHLDSLISHAVGLARSVSARANSGAITRSEIALLQASASVVSNLIGVFSSLGDLGAATQLYGSWSILDSSLGQARNRLSEKGNLSQERQDRINSFIKSLDSEIPKTRSAPRN